MTAVRKPATGAIHAVGKRHHGVPIDNAHYQEIYLAIVDRLEMGQNASIDADHVKNQIDDVVEMFSRQHGFSLSTKARATLSKMLVDEILGLGPLEILLRDDTVSDVLVNGPDEVYAEREGVLTLTDVSFRDAAHIMNVINRIAAKVGRRVDEASPMVDARLPDGSRVNAVIPPLAIDGPVLSIRRFGTGPVSLRDLAERGTLSGSMGNYLKSAVHAKCNILVCGGTGAGKTTLLNALSRYISSRQRVITIEDSAELQLQQKHVLRLETRPANIEGKGCVTIRDLVRNALRMRPDRIIVGEVRSEEILDMIQAMNTGHEGSMTTVHANTVDEAFTRMLAMLAMAGTRLSEKLMLEMLVGAIDVLVHVSRDSSGRRVVSEIAETVGLDGGNVQLNRIFKHQRREDRWVCTGHTIHASRFEEAGVPLKERWLK